MTSGCLLAFVRGLTRHFAIFGRSQMLRQQPGRGSRGEIKIFVCF
jgi:hypothetical protein